TDRVAEVPRGTAAQARTGPAAQRRPQTPRPHHAGLEGNRTQGNRLRVPRPAAAPEGGAESRAQSRTERGAETATAAQAADVTAPGGGSNWRSWRPLKMAPKSPWKTKDRRRPPTPPDGAL